MLWSRRQASFTGSAIVRCCEGQLALYNDFGMNVDMHFLMHVLSSHLSATAKPHHSAVSRKIADMMHILLFSSYGLCRCQAWHFRDTFIGKEDHSCLGSGLAIILNHFARPWGRWARIHRPPLNAKPHASWISWHWYHRHRRWRRPISRKYTCTDRSSSLHRRASVSIDALYTSRAYTRWRALTL